MSTMASTTLNDRVTLSISDEEELRNAKDSLQHSACCCIQSVGLLISDPRLVRDSTVALQTFVVDTLKKLASLEEVRLAVRGPGKQGGEEGNTNTVSADAIADLLTSLLFLQVPLSLELSVSKVEGSLQRLCAVLQANRSLFRVSLHHCDNQDDTRRQGCLPLLDALTQCQSLQSLSLQAVQFPVGDVTANVLAKFASHAKLERLEFKHCVNLGDDELLPLMESPLHNLQHLKLSTGFGLQQEHAGSPWGDRVVSVLAGKLRDPDCRLRTLALTTNHPAVSFRSIALAMEGNTSLVGLHLYHAGTDGGTTTTTTARQEMIRILSSCGNTSLHHCSSLGTGAADAAVLHFYTRLNQLNRGGLLGSFAANDDDESRRWTTTLREQSHDHRIVHYLLTHNPSLLPLPRR